MHGSLPVSEMLPRRGPRVPIPLKWPLALRLAVREMRGGLRGFGVFLACIALGVAAIAGVNSLSRSLTEGLSREGRTILGADLAFSLRQREATQAEYAVLEGYGSVSVIASLRGMAHAGDNGSALVEIKAVDDAYPTIGSVETTPPVDLRAALAEEDGAFGVVVDPVLLARLDLSVGDEITVGRARVVLRAGLVSEPDNIADGIGFGPRMLMSVEALRASDLLQPGSLVRWTYRLALPGGASDDAALTRVSDAVVADSPEAGWRVRSRLNADPGFQRNIERFAQFLSLVGLTALIVGGVGVANAVRGFVERKRDSIATIKSLGAPGGQVVSIYLTQVMLIAAMGVVIGLAVGAAIPFAAAAALRDILPVPIAPTLAIGELGIAALYGILIALAFAIGPLGRAHDIQVTHLFRDQVDRDRRWPRWRYVAIAVLSGAALLWLCVAAAYDRRVALIFLGAIVAAFILLRLVAEGLMALARRLPRPRAAAPRLALANIHRPGALTPSLVLSLGLGVTLLVTLALIDSNMRRQLSDTLPEVAPSFFFVDIASADVDAFESFMAEQAPEGELDRVPMMRGRIVSLAGVPADEIRAADDVGWVLQGDRGITYSSEPPEGSRLVAGEWWAPDTQERLVSFDSEIAEGLGLSLGDEVVVNVLGRDVSARVANLRTVEWRSLGINFVMVFSPNVFAGAPHMHLATLTFAQDEDRSREPALLRDIGRAFPTITSVRVRDALDAVDALVGQLALAIRGASSVALAASVLVLAGALAAGHRARLYDAVVFKTLGATRGRLLSAYALEYGALGLATAVFGMAAGGLAAYVIVTQIMQLDFVFIWGGVIVAAALTIVATIALGLLGTLRILNQKPAPYLRSL
ncbi:MAG: ABC transporter permease [Microvirga sp.]|nr:ABC transporter permease [Microvirga sp.]